jgi:hypothetical protein
MRNQAVGPCKYFASCGHMADDDESQTCEECRCDLHQQCLDESREAHRRGID